MAKIKKIIASILISVLLFFYVAYPPLSFAQTVTDTPTPTPTVDSSSPTPTPDTTTTPTVSPTPTVDPSLTPTDSPTPTPTIDPNATPTPTPTTDPSLSTTPTVTPTSGSDPVNNGTVDNTATSSAVTGDNTITATGSSDPSNPNNPSNTNSSSSSSSSSGGSGASVATGDALSVITSDTGVNVNSINSNIINQTLNIFVAQNGSLDLSAPFAIAAQAVSDHPNSPVINVSVTSVNNFAYITNDIASQAITGQNNVTAADQSASISTGNAFSVVSLLNKVNFTVDNSQIHVLTINIFGTLNGNIILPDMNASTNCNTCGISIAANNNATVANNVNSSANSGNNIATGSATITTGDSVSTTNTINFVNTNFFGTTAQVLFINDFGYWNGNFIGWGNLSPTSGGSNLAFFNLIPGGNASGSGTCSSCGGPLSIYNGANVVNNISSTANSGGNSLTGNGSITTGNAYSAVSLINFINSNFINSIGFFGFINIFGNWTGNIGGASEFAALNANQNNDNTPQVQTASTNSGDAPQEQGGQLSVTNSNNVGAFVYPGDTVTFFINTTNTGTGKVYGAKLNLFLIYRGELAGGTQFSLGDILPGHTVRLSTGLVLSKYAPPGSYIARAYVTGNVGPDNAQVNAGANSTFNVFGSVLGASSTNNHNGPKTSVLGAHNLSPKAAVGKIAQDMLYFSLLVLVVFAYIALRLIRKREYVYAFIQSDSFKEKLYTLRMLLL